ncbi:unnamed protein product [Caenorhabditis bovis]|uniref:Sphingomyelin phosphodiesterase n=1 Tax=Caenorhabditis bovis TaxID=2654633 RepID=A0A8S1FBE3_9PELO|nr:unnamed protein product [Caenorhabditis bovis]
MRTATFLLLIFALFFQGSNAVTECEECTAIVDLLRFRWGDEHTEDCIVEIAKFICDTFHIEDNDVCNYIVSDFSDEFMYVIKQILITPHQLCGLLMHNDCGEFVDPLLETWNITIPGNQPPFIPQKAVPEGKPTLRVLHLTDLHVDMYYTPGLEVECDTPQCCRPQDLNVEITENVRVPAGQWGNVGNCDTPYWLFTNMLEHITNTSGHLDYVMVSGDLVSHTVWAYTPETHSFMVRNLSSTIRAYFPNTPVYFAVGNHEGVPIDNLAPHFTPKKYHPDWLYDTMAESWKGWVPEDQQKELKYNGCYMKKIYQGLRIISLNNVYGDRMNFWLYINQTDPDGTLAWLIKQLSDAEKAGDKVHIVAHIPGADGEALEGYAINYYRIINRFANTVVGQFFGHTHSEKFYMMYADPDDYKSTPTNVVYSAPSVTTYSDFHPAYRIYTIDGDYPGSTYQVIDFEEWFFNLTENNRDPWNAQWKQLYKSANLEYGLKSQIPSEWNNLIERMKTDQNLFTKYYHNIYRRDYFDGLHECTSQSCRNSHLCDARKFHQTNKLCADLEGADNVKIKEKKSPNYTARFRSKNTRRDNHDCKI